MWRLAYYKERIIQCVSIIGSVASLLGIAVPYVLASDTTPWWIIVLFAISLLFGIPAIWLIFRSERSTRVFRANDTSAIGEYLFQWIETGRRVAISTGDMSWADDANLMQLLEHKAAAGELTVVLPEEIERSDRLKERGATIFAYGDAGPVRSTFTITNVGTTGARVAIGWPSGNYHVIQEFSATDDHPTFHLVSQLMNLATEHAHAR